MRSLVVAAVLIGIVVYVAARCMRWLRSHWFLVLAGRWLTGSHPDGRLRTDAGWFRPGSKALTRTGHATRYWHRPRLHRAFINVGSLLMTLAELACLIRWPLQTITALACEFALGVALVVLRVVSRHRRRTWLLPLHLRTHEIAGHPRAALASSWITVEVDGNAVQAAYFQFPTGWPADDKDKQRFVATAAATCGLEAPEVSWRLAGPDPKLSLTRSAPPPARVSLADIREAIDVAGQDDLVWGLGKQARVVTTSLASDSPHIGLSMGSGAGKSVTARALVAQRLYRGDIALILDIKMISHQWAAGLPNVHIARRPHEIHAALMWLAGDDRSGEVQRRNEVALAGADIDGNVHSVVGPRLIVVCEELNATIAALRRYWLDLRDSDDPKRSPALGALDYTSFTGRQVNVNLIYIAQRLSVKASGGDGDARENIGVIGFGRYSASNWKMLAPDHAMPPSSRKPGRLQVVADGVRETQGAFVTAREARALALAGTVTALPAGMPGSRSVQDMERMPISSPDLRVVSGTSAPERSRGQFVKLSEVAASDGVPLSLDALRKASQREGFPPRKGRDRTAGLYDAVELAEFAAGRRWR